MHFFLHLDFSIFEFGLLCVEIMIKEAIASLEISETDARFTEAVSIIAAAILISADVNGGPVGFN